MSYIGHIFQFDNCDTKTQFSAHLNADSRDENHSISERLTEFICGKQLVSCFARVSCLILVDDVVKTRPFPVYMSRIMNVLAFHFRINSDRLLALKTVFTFLFPSKAIRYE